MTRRGRCAVSSNVLSTLGRVDVVVNAAGVSSFGTADTIDEAEWDRVLGVNLKGTWLVARSVLPVMVAAGFGQHREPRERRGHRRRPVADGVQRVEGRCRAAHAQPGDRLRHARRARELSVPGLIETPMTALLQDGTLKPVLEWFEQQHMLGRAGKPEEVAACALFLASDDASFVTGHALAVDGGYLAGRKFPGTL